MYIMNFSLTFNVVICEVSYLCCFNIKTWIYLLKPKIMLKSEKQDWSTIFKNIFVSSSMCFVALINYGLLENTALLRSISHQIWGIHNLCWKWKVSKIARENMDDPLVHKFSTNMFYGKMWQNCWVHICQFGQTGKTDQFKIIRACYKKR